jgi:peptide/nickel transport system substrate-binding protein
VNFPFEVIRCITRFNHRGVGGFKPELISLFSASFILLALASTGACRQGAPPRTLVIAIEQPPRGFDPRFSTTIVPSARIMQLIYDTLVVKNEHFEFVPSLAERFEESPDSKTFTFYLRPGVVFHNGKPLTSSDVKYTFDSILSPETKSPIRGAVDKISSIETPDPSTVIFHAREPFYTFLGNLPAIGVIPAGAGSENITMPVGSGPYRFVSYAEGEPVRLEANPAYWGGAPSIARVWVKVVPDNSTRQAELMSGAVDLCYNAQFDPETVRALARRNDIQVKISDGASIGYLGLNLSSSSKLSNQKLRQAIAYGIDRDVIIHRLLRDQARPANAILPPEHWAYDADITVYNHDPERSKRLLDEAGYPDPDGDGPETRLQLVMMTSTNQLSRNIASILQDQLRRVGIQLQLQSLESATLFDKLNKAQFDMYYLIGVGFNQLTDVFQFVYHSRYQNPEFNDAVARLRSATTPEQMREPLAEITSILARREYCPNKQVNGEFQMAQGNLISPSARRESYLHIAALLTDRGGQNRMRYCNPQLDEWIVQAEREPDRAGKLVLYSKVQEAVSNDLPQVYLWYPSNVLIARSRVQNIEIEASGSWYFIARLTLQE